MDVFKILHLGNDPGNAQFLCRHAGQDVEFVVARNGKHGLIAHNVLVYQEISVAGIAKDYVHIAGKLLGQVFATDGIFLYDLDVFQIVS